MSAPHPLIVLPVPPEITMPNDPVTGRDSLDQYVKEFVIPHGYKITISHSSKDKCSICHYACHRGGKPFRPKSKNTNPSAPSIPKTSHVSRSIKIDCPFHLTARLDRGSKVWTLTHTQVGHNHGPSDTEAVSSNITFAPEIHDMALRLQQLSPQRQHLALLEINLILHQQDAMQSSISPAMVETASFKDEELDLALQLLSNSDVAGASDLQETQDCIQSRSDEVINNCNKKTVEEGSVGNNQITITTEPIDTVEEGSVGNNQITITTEPIGAGNGDDGHDPNEENTTASISKRASPAPVDNNAPRQQRKKKKKVMLQKSTPTAPRTRSAALRASSRVARKRV
ncbi:hypothetical protein DFH28DRAFT_935763 [Melampsora americana]|nr:hypothetical protein DFH28DRAFT_935763 [Melampsora americana]